MFRSETRAGIALLAALLVLTVCAAARAQGGGGHSPLPWPIVFPEARQTQVRDPSQLPQAPLPEIPEPTTVINRREGVEPRYLSLDEAMRISLVNMRVVRVVAGATAVASGATIYDTQITNTTIDQQQARFDPNVIVNNTWSKSEVPQAVLDPMNPGQSLIAGAATNNHNLDVAVIKQNPLGGTARLDVNANRAFTQPGVFPLNPQTRSSAALSYTQPLLQGFGTGPNLAPIVVARINTERSYFQFKDAVQENVRSVAEAYWNLVAARVDVWARRQQVGQATEAQQQTAATVRIGISDAGKLAQANVLLANFKANLVASEANLLQREGALRNLLGLPPSDPLEIVPTTPPSAALLRPEWRGLLVLAQERRPDIVELKLIIEADQQLLMQANNLALPQLDAVALYRWNGLDGEMPNGNGLSSQPGQFTDWTLGVNFSVPVGLRQARAGLRQRELIMARDRANLDQGLHAAYHSLATGLRALDQNYEQYLAFVDARKASRQYLAQQSAIFRIQLGGTAGGNQTNFLNYRQALTDWGNAVSAEAAALADYNSQLVTMERLTGTILESHGVVFYEERYGSIGPLGRMFHDACYPSNYVPSPNVPRYSNSDAAAENSFDLQDSDLRIRRLPIPTEDLPPAPRNP
jgi:outer membrane protein TolC